MSFDIFYKQGGEYGEGILLEKYKENFQLYSAQQSVEGPIYKRWCKMQKKKDEFSDTAIPVKINLGNQNEAIKILTYFLEQLNAPVEKEEAPF